MDSTWMSVDRWLDKEVVGNIFFGVLLCILKIRDCIVEDKGEPGGDYISDVNKAYKAATRWFHLWYTNN